MESRSEIESPPQDLMARVRLWRYLLGDDKADVDYWMTRVENEPA